MTATPVLLLAYNRADKFRSLVDRLRALKPELVLVAVDGPRATKPDDAERVAAVHAVIDEIDWGARVETLLRTENLGLRRAVAGAVDWAIGAYGRTIVIEDDALPGDHWIPWATAMLDRFADDERIAHISGYNVVPPTELDRPDAPSRLTIYPESFAWATWERAWRHYDDSMAWAREAGVRDLARVTGSSMGGRRWRQQFDDAANDRISTWAYRWIATMWSKGWVALGPNRNLVSYDGYDEGTHTRTKAPWSELPLDSGPLDALLADVAPRIDARAERYTGRTVFGETAFGVAKGAVVSALLERRKRRR
ncbi:MAG TPA: hypothetical protein VNQ52_01540 [Microbacteriaceae bacterium]|nr:hypothetical protein [Microbacteriaceae bacterium]